MMQGYMQQNPLVTLMSLFTGGGQKLGMAMPATGAKATGAPALDQSALLAEIFGNAGQTMKAGGSVGSVAPPPMGGNVDMRKYGQGGGERLFYGQNAQGGATPISAVPGIGQGAPAPQMNAAPTGQAAPRPGGGANAERAVRQIMMQALMGGR